MSARPRGAALETLETLLAEQPRFLFLPLCPESVMVPVCSINRLKNTKNIPQRTFFGVKPKHYMKELRGIIFFE